MSEGYQPKGPANPPPGFVPGIRSSVRPPTAPALDPSDPAYVVIAAVEALQKQAVRDLGALVQKLSDDIAASAVLAEQAARAKAEVVVTQAGEWAAAQIRDAGRKVAEEIIEARTDALEADTGRGDLIKAYWWFIVVVIFLAGLAIWFLPR